MQQKEENFRGFLENMMWVISPWGLTVSGHGQLSDLRVGDPDATQVVPTQNQARITLHP